MSSSANKIRLNKNLWFTILGNKLVFGNSALSKGLHYTVSFGNRSGIFDLHLTNNKGEHYTVIKISQQNIYEILPNLISQIKDSIFDLSPFDENKCYSDKSDIYKVEQLGDVLSELGDLTRKNKIIIDKDSPEFSGFVDRLMEKQTSKIIDLIDLKNETQFFGVVRSISENYFIVKNEFFGDQIFRLNNIDLDINSIFEKILGKDVYNNILDRINEGISYLKE